MSDAHSQNEFNATMQKLRVEYKAQLAERIEQIQQAIDALSASDTPSEDALKDAYTIAHILYGNGSVFGFPNITEAAGPAQDALTTHTDPEEGQSPAPLAEIIEKLKTLLAVCQAEQSA